MGRIIMTVVVALLLIFGVAYFSLGYIAGSVASSTLKTDVSIGGIQLGPNSVTVRGIEIANVEGAELEPAFACSRIYVQASIFELMEKRAKVQQIVVENPQMAIELYDRKGADNNWTRMTKHLSEGQDAAPATDESGEPAQFMIEHLLITDIEVRAQGGMIGDEPIDINIDKIEEFNMSDESGVPTQAIMSAVLQVVMKKVVQDVIKNPLKFGGDTIKGATDTGKGLIEKISPFGGDKGEGGGGLFGD